MQSANFIGGRWRASVSGRAYLKRNPFCPAEALGEFPASDEGDVELAVDAASQAAGAWAGLPGPERGEFLRLAADVLESRLQAVADDITREMGKPLRESRGEVRRGIDTLRFYAGEGWRSQGEIFHQSKTGNPIHVLHRPVGVVALITPWNFPLSIPMWKSAPALAYGNTVVLKPAQESPRTALHIADCLNEAGLPEGVFNVVVGSGVETGTPLITNPRVRAVSFTGSVSVGHEVRNQATALGKRVQLELGGHSPLLVMADSDLSRAADAAYAGAFWSAGQKCTATRRIYVEGDVYESFRSALLERMERGVVGDPADPSTEVGPLVNEVQMKSVLAGVARGQAEGGAVLAGGERVGDQGYLVAPTVVEDVRDDAFLSREEVFGPVVSLYRFGDLGEAIARANDSAFGLSAAIFTTDAGNVQRFATELRAGILRVNAATAGGEPHVPFGGTKDSGYGPREQGRAARDFYTETVTVYQNP